MPTLRLYVQDERVGQLLRRSVSRQGDKVRAAARETAQAAAEQIVTRGRADIRSAPGNWGQRWPDGLNAEVSEGGGNIRISVTHDVPYFMVFERGALIKGKPLLWIPLSSNPFKVRARDYPGRLFKTVRKSDGLQLLGSRDDGQMKYFAKESVTIPKKFHITEIARQVASNMKLAYRKIFQSM